MPIQEASSTTLSLIDPIPTGAKLRAEAKELKAGLNQGDSVRSGAPTPLASSISSWPPLAQRSSLSSPPLLFFIQLARCTTTPLPSSALQIIMIIIIILIIKVSTRLAKLDLSGAELAPPYQAASALPIWTGELCYALEWRLQRLQLFRDSRLPIVGLLFDWRK